jgi:hypothetical protein
VDQLTKLVTVSNSSPTAALQEGLARLAKQGAHVRRLTVRFHQDNPFESMSVLGSWVLMKSLPGGYNYIQHISHMSQLKGD